MAYVQPPDPECSPVPLGVQSPRVNNNFRNNIPDYLSPAGIDDTGPTPTPNKPPPTPTPNNRASLSTYGNSPPSPKPTRTATQTATASKPINPADYPASILKRGDIDTGLALPSNVFGPYPQTLFLGCSVVSFNTSLGWGNQPSQLSVTLVEDTAPHYVMTHDGGIYRSGALAQQNSVNHYYTTLKPLKNNKGIITETAAAYKQRVASFLDTNGNLIVPGKIFYHYNTNRGIIEQKYWLGPDPGFIASKNKFRRNQRVVTGTDPITGDKNVELGEPVNIIGCPVRFQLDDFIFCGIVKSWRSVNSGTGGRSYQVDIEGPNELVSQTQIILNNYAGGVFMKGKPIAKGSGTYTLQGEEIKEDAKTEFPISGPSDDIWNENIDLTNAFQGNIHLDGNIPNIINVYGFLEAMAPGGFGGAAINDEGISTNSVIYTINYLLSLPRKSTKYPGETTRSIFSPFGGLVGRTPMTDTPKAGEKLNMRIYTPVDNEVPKAKNNIYPINYAQASKPNYGFPASRLREVSKAGLSVAGTVSGFLEIGDDGAVARNTSTPPNIQAGTEYNIFDFGLLPPDDISGTIPVSTSSSGSGGNNEGSDGSEGNANNTPTGVDNQHYKQLYYLDLGELPSVPMQLKTDCNQSIVDLNTFITELCDKSGVDFFYELLYIKVYNNFPPVKIIKLRTVTRRVQPSDRAISDYIAKLRDAGVTVSSVSLGKEFNSSSRPRTILIGGKQQRLFQTKNYGLAYRASDYIYHTTEKRLLHYGSGRPIPNAQFKNRYRMPNPGSVRDPYALAKPTTITKLNEYPIDQYYDGDTSWNEAHNMDFGSSLLLLPIFGNYIQSAGTGFDPDVTEAIYSKTKTPPDLSDSNKFLISIGKSVFSWGFAKIIEKSRQEYFDKGLHYLKQAWPSLFGTTSQFSSSQNREDFLYATETSEDAILQNFASAIADIGKNTYNKVLSHYHDNKAAYLVNENNNWSIDSASTRFFPIMYNSICPYFGSLDYIDKSRTQYNMIDKIKKPRCVWFDTWQNCLVIEFNVKELPQTKLELKGIYNGGNFYVTESELRAAMSGWDSWIGYMSMRIHDPHIKQMVKNATCGGRKIEPPSKPTPPDRTRKEPPAPKDADMGATAAVNSGQGANKPQQKDTKSDMQVTSDNDWDACAIFTSIFKISSGFNEKTKSVSAGAATPKNTKSGLNFSLTSDLKILHDFFKRVGEEYYGRQFMVRLPMILAYRDRSTLINLDPRPTPTPAPSNNVSPTDETNNTAGDGSSTGSSRPGIDVNSGTRPPVYVNIGTSSNPRYLTEGSGKIYSNYKVSPEGAWEEYGNTIDDSLMIGGYAASIFSDEQGKIQPILGFPANDRFDHEAFKICEWIKTNVCQLVNGPNVFYLYDILKRGNVFSNATRYTDFDGSKPRDNKPCS